MAMADGAMTTRGVLVPVATVACVMLTLCNFWLLLMGQQGGQHCLSMSRREDWYKVAYGQVVGAYLAPTVWLASVAFTQHIRQAVVYLLWNWGSQCCFLLIHSLHCSEELGVWGPAFFLPGFLLMIGGTFAGMELATSRLQALELQALQELGGARLKRLLFWCKVGTVPLLMLVYLQALGPLMVLVFRLAGAVWLLAMLAWLVLAAWAMRRVMRLARVAAWSVPHWMAAWALRAHGAVRFELACLVAALLTTFVRFLVGATFLYNEEQQVLQMVSLAFDFVDGLCNLLCALLLSGALTSSRLAGKRAAVARQRQARRARAVHGWAKRVRGDEFAAWDQKVQELAGKGLPLNVLLDFYGSLPEAIEGFDPGRHTTADVVHQVVVPLTAGHGCAAAELLMPGARPWPERMVTHAWSNTFRDLMAAVVADAFQEGEYGFYAQLLERDLPRLRLWVEKAGVGGRCYWICAFAVNQHLCICGSAQVDSVTGRSIPPCSCSLPKAGTQTPPLLPDGRSVPCEANKFDDLVKFLASWQPGFTQVVAMDAALRTFSRAWCLAEMAAANEMGMRQELKLGRAAELTERKEELRGLRIQDMEASKAEDKVMILNSIPDHEAFNRSLQHLIFEELLPSWSSLDALERMATAGRVIRWHTAGLASPALAQEPDEQAPEGGADSSPTPPPSSLAISFKMGI